MSDQASCRPNVLFLLSDEHSYRFFSHLDPSGEGEPVRTPAFDALAAQSCVFHTTYCQVSLCTPSRICMLAGVNPMKSGGWTNGAMMRPDRTTLPASLADAGYATCLVGKMHLGGNRQFVGFQHRPYGDLTGRTGHQWEPLNRKGGNRVDLRIPDAGITEIPESAHQEQVIVRESVAWLREHTHKSPQQPWMLCASFSRPHFPLTAPKRFIDHYWPDRATLPKIRRTGDTVDHPMTQGMAEGFQIESLDEASILRGRAGYFSCVEYLDEIIGDMLATLERSGLLDNTIIVYTSDHGELAGEHGMWWKNSWHEAAARVPLMVSLPEHRRGEFAPIRLQTPVSLADLFPTLCGLCQADIPGDLDGVDLSDVIQQGVEPQRGPVFMDNPIPRWGEGMEHRMVRDGRWKYIAFRGEAVPDLLFDLEADPLEQHNLASDPDHAQTAQRLRGLIDASWDFAEAQTQGEKDMAESARLRLESSASGGNIYHMPNGDWVDAETPLYEPKVVTDDPADFVGDFPQMK